jgi:hypothetical protein
VRHANSLERHPPCDKHRCHESLFKFRSLRVRVTVITAFETMRCEYRCGVAVFPRKGDRPCSSELLLRFCFSEPCWQPEASRSRRPLRSRTRSLPIPASTARLLGAAAEVIVDATGHPQKREPRRALGCWLIFFCGNVLRKRSEEFGRLARFACGGEDCAIVLFEEPDPIGDVAGVPKLALDPQMGAEECCREFG